MAPGGASSDLGPDAEGRWDLEGLDVVGSAQTDAPDQPSRARPHLRATTTGSLV